MHAAGATHTPPLAFSFVCLFWEGAREEPFRLEHSVHAVVVFLRRVLFHPTLFVRRCRCSAKTVRAHQVGTADCVCRQWFDARLCQLGHHVLRLG